MELEGTREIAAPRAKVWAALNDPEVLKACIPGCQEMTGSPEEGFEAVVTQKVGPVKATFRGKVTLEDVVEGESYRIVGEGSGGVAGFARGAAAVRLEDAEAGGTRLSFDVDAKVGGKLAQLGSRIIDGFARSTADKFFDSFRGAVEGDGAAGVEAAPAEGGGGQGDGAAPAAEPAKRKGWLGRLMG